MASFDFPDPALQPVVTNPLTGNTYEWKEPPGKWIVSTALSNNQDIPINEELLDPIYNTIEALQEQLAEIEGLDLTNALSALAVAQQDIIELKSKVSSLELTSFLILE